MSGVWRCGTHAFSLDRPLVMGILNVTPDSFSDGGAHDDVASAVSCGKALMDQGASLVDVGGESTRPGSTPVSVAEELRRVLPVVSALARAGVPVSVDTRHAEVASACTQAGASVINDIGGFRDPDMRAAAVESDAGLVVMHMPVDDPQNMPSDLHYVDVVAEVGSFLLAQATRLEGNGVAHERIMLDPGPGFGKTTEQNLELLRRLPELTSLGYPVLVAVSRKRFIGDIADEPDPGKRLGGSIAVALDAVHRGAAMLRVHDVAVTVQALALDRALSGADRGIPPTDG